MKVIYKIFIPLLACIFMLSGCNGSDPVTTPTQTPSAATSPTPAPAETATAAETETAIITPSDLPTASQPDATGIDNSATDIGAMMQEYDGENIIEILMIKYDGQQAAFEEYGAKNPEIELINNTITAEILTIYQQFMGGEIEGNIEIKSYPFLDDRFVQIITSCVVYPETQPEQFTRMWSWNFSKVENKWLTLDEMMGEYKLTKQSITDAFNALYVPADAGEIIVSVEPAGFLINTIPASPKTHFLLEVTAEMESDPYKLFFLYTPDNDEIEELDAGGIMFDPQVYSMQMMEPPLKFQE